MSRLLISLLTLSLIAVAAPLTAGAGGDGGGNPVLERHIYVDFFVMAADGETNPVTDDDVLAAIDFANVVWAPVHVTFIAGQIRRVSTEHLHKLSGDDLPWPDEIQGDAQLLGLSANAFPSNLSPPSTSIGQWIEQIATKLTPTRIPVFVGTSGLGFSNCSSSYPHDDGWDYLSDGPSGTGWSENRSRAIKCVRDLNGILALAHEFGHYFGVFHTPEVLSLDGLNQSIPTLDQVTVDYWDLIYKPDGQGIRTFVSRQDAVNAGGPYSLKDTGSPATQCQSLGNPGLSCGNPAFDGTECLYQCNFVNGSGSTVTYDGNDPEMAGWNFPSDGDGDFAINIMSGVCSKCDLRFSDSQIDVIKDHLDSTKGQRNQLSITFPPTTTKPGPEISSSLSYGLDLFWRNTNGRLIHKASISTGITWQSSSDLGGSLKSAPAAVSWSAGRTDVFWQDNGDRLQHIWYPLNGGWSWVQELGTGLASSPGSSSWAPGRLDVFWKDSGSRLQHIWYPFDNDWSWVQELASDVKDSPSAVSWGNERIDVFWRDSDDRLKHIWHPFPGWSWEQDLAGGLTSAPTVASWGSGRLDVFWRGMNGTLRHIWYPFNGGWSWEQDLGGSLASAPAAVGLSSNRLFVFWRDDQDRMRYKYYPAPSGDWSDELEVVDANLNW